MFVVSLSIIPAFFIELITFDALLPTTADQLIVTDILWNHV